MTRQPNILLLVIDTLRYDAITGANRSDAPFLSTLTRSAVTFDRAFSTHDSTPSSHFSMLSGFVTGWQTPLDDPAVGLPAQLSRQGYDSFGVAANGNLTPGALRVLGGFRQYSCLYDEWGKLSPAERQPYLTDIRSRLDAYKARDNDWNTMMLYASAPRVLARIDTALNAARQPFFGFVNVLEPHDPYLPRPSGESRAERERVDPDLRFRQLPSFMAAPDQIGDAATRASFVRRLQLADGRAWSLSDDLSQEAIRVYRKRYQSEVREADDAIRHIFGSLERRGLLDSTIVIVTSDHGEAFGESGLLTHSFQDGGDREATQHVPLLVVLPAAYRATPITVDRLVSIADIAPTVYEIAGIDWTPIAQESWVGNYGKSLLPYFGGGPARTLVRAVRRSGQPSAAEVDASRRLAEERLRALGYLNK